MIHKIPAQTRFFAIPAGGSGKTFTLTIRCCTDFLSLQLIPVSPENAAYIAEYTLPFAPEETVLEADERVFEHLTWLDSLLPGREADSIKDQHPRFHFSPRCGWLNDPNGMYFKDGVWHLFFQHNPLGAYWRNMHWGHAVSHDLLHWEEKPIALYPDSTGTMYSGSAVIDHSGSAGFGKDAVLLYYTSCSYTVPSTATQNLAVLKEDKWVKYENNPVVPCLFNQEERDPNIAFDPDCGLWRMVIYLGDEETKEFMLLASRDLLQWQETDRYKIADDRECPGIRRMKDLVTGEYLWIFTAANGCYRIGRINESGKITFLSEADRFLYGDAYAGQFFYNAPDNRNIFMAWVRMPDSMFHSWSGCMTLPLEITLSDGKLEVSPAVDVPAVHVSWQEKTILHGSARELIIDPDEDMIRDGDRTVKINAGHQWSGYLLKDRALIEYFDEKKRFFAAFYFPDADLL